MDVVICVVVVVVVVTVVDVVIRVVVCVVLVVTGVVVAVVIVVIVVVLAVVVVANIGTSRNIVLTRSFSFYLQDLKRTQLLFRCIYHQYKSMLLFHYECRQSLVIHIPTNSNVVQ